MQVNLDAIAYTEYNACMNNAEKDLSEAAVYAWVQMMRASTIVLSKIEADLKAASLPPLVWYDALIEIKRAGMIGLRPLHLQDQMLLAQYNLSRLLDRLAKARYIERHPCEEDGRGQILFITKEGRQLLRDMWPVYRDALHDHFATKLVDTEITTISKILMKLR